MRQGYIPKNMRRQDYDRAVVTVWKMLGILGKYLLLDGIVSFLFYQSLLPFAVGVLLFPLFWRREATRLIRKRKGELKRQFKDCLRSVAGALRAGYSMENAWREAQGDMEQQYGRNSDVCMELRQMQYQLECNVPLEQLVEDWGNRSHVEDMEQFGAIFAFAKRSGGDFIAIISNTVTRLTDRMELQQELETNLSARRMEQRIMNAVPLFILAFVRFGSGGFLDVLYHNPAGIMVMTGCLAVYAGAFLWAERLMQIEV